jgi:hypothetical protein
VPSGIQATCQVLSTTRNRAVVPLVVAGIHSTSPEVRAAIIRAAMRRHDAATHTQLVRHYDQLDETDQLVLCDTHRVMPHHAAPVLRRAILEGDATLCTNACAIVQAAGDFEMLPTLLKAAENRKHPHTATILNAITGLTDVLYQHLAEWTIGATPGAHDPSFARHHVLTALEQSLSRYAKHERFAILDAFLLLAPIDNATFLKILRDPHHACHADMIRALSTSQDFGVMERLVELLRDTETPTAALEIIANRGDDAFVRILLHGLKHPAPVRVLHNMKRMQRVVWLESRRELLLELDGRTQAVAVDLAAASGLITDTLFELLSMVLRGGLAEGRRASCQALARFENETADALIRAALDDPDAGVQAAAVRQMRTRRVPDALQRLVRLLDAPAAEVRNAARTSLAEFNFIRYKSMFDLLDSEAARTTGRLVHKVDDTAIQKLQEELSSPAISARLRAIEMAIAMAATDDVEPHLIELANNENVVIRKEALLALGHSHRAETIRTLERAALDPNRTIADAARISLALAMKGRGSAPEQARGGRQS